MAEFDLDTQVRVEALSQANRIFTDTDQVLETAERFYGFLKGLDVKPEREVLIREPNATVYAPRDGDGGEWLVEDGTHRAIYRGEDGSYEISCYTAAELRQYNSNPFVPEYAPIRIGREWVDPNVFDVHSVW